MFSSLAAAVVVIQFIPAIIGTNNGTKKYFISEQLRIVAHMEWKPRYFEAWVKHMETNHADAFALSGGRRMKFTYPDVTTANGLTTFIIAFITWNGGNATRVNVMGRKVGNKWIKSSTRKGTADVTATIRGRSCKFEVKVGRDKPRPEQLAEQARERASGGVYEFISTPGNFYAVYDMIAAGEI